MPGILFLPSYFVCTPELGTAQFHPSPKGKTQIRGPLPNGKPAGRGVAVTAELRGADEKGEPEAKDPPSSFGR